jgi:lysophospholipase L1-like esterase
MRWAKRHATLIWVVLLVLVLLVCQASSAAPFKVVHIGDSHVAGRTFPDAAGATLRQLAGADVSYRHLGKNGATIDYFLDSRVAGRVAAMAPDLLVVSVGTNESYGRFDPQVYVGKLERFVAMYRGCCREILLTTLPGNYKHGRLNPLNSVVADTQLWYAKSRGIPVWDVYHAVGPAYWRANGMMDRLGVHFTGRGYAMQGRMLGQAIARRWLL